MTTTLLRPLARRLVLNRLRRWRGGPLRLELPGGRALRFGKEDGHAPGHLRVLDDRAFARVLLGGEVGAGESYVAGEWDSDDLPALVSVFLRDGQSGAVESGLSWFGRLGRLWRHRRRANTRRGSERNIHAHYDLSNDLYAIFLDATMAYSCAVYDDPTWTLERAQRRKYDLICERLALGSNDHLLEIGTGWGGLAIHAARTTGCRVTTITVSRRQHEFARQRVIEEGLAGRVDVRYCDYRDIQGRYDKVVSVEMFEAVGREFWDAYFLRCRAALRPGGSMLLQTIAWPEWGGADPYRGASWIQKYIFPGSMIPTLREAEVALRRNGLAVRGAEEIGAHYATTLRDWRRRFWAGIDRVRDLGFDERFVRMWDYYLASCEALFATRTGLNYQLLLS